MGGAFNAANGGSFKDGFIGGAVGNAVGLAFMGPQSALANVPGIQGVALRTGIAAVSGGVAAELSGGKFANGAVTAAFFHLFNREISLPDDYDPKRERALNRLAFSRQMMMLSRAGRMILQTIDSIRLRFEFVDTFVGREFNGRQSEQARVIPYIGGYRVVMTYDSVSLGTLSHELYQITSLMAARAGFMGQGASNYLLPVGDPFDANVSNEATVEWPAVRAQNIIGREVHVALGGSPQTYHPRVNYGLLPQLRNPYGRYQF